MTLLCFPTICCIGYLSATSPIMYVEVSKVGYPQVTDTQHSSTKSLLAKSSVLELHCLRICLRKTTYARQRISFGRYESSSSPQQQRCQYPARVALYTCRVLSEFFVGTGTVYINNRPSRIDTGGILGRKPQWACRWRKISARRQPANKNGLGAENYLRPQASQRQQYSGVTQSLSGSVNQISGMLDDFVENKYKISALTKRSTQKK